jgi:hypothetical protein
MFRIQKCNSVEQAESGAVYLAMQTPEIPNETDYVVINRNWVFKLGRSPDCTLDELFTNVTIRKLMSARLDTQVTVEPLQHVQRTSGHSSLVRMLAMFKLSNPEVGPPTHFRTQGAGVLISLGGIPINTGESNVECIVKAGDVNEFIEKFNANYNNVKYYFDRLVMSAVNHMPTGPVNYLDYLTLDNRVPALAKLEIEIPLNDKVGGTFAGLDYADCVLDIIQPNTIAMYDYIRTTLAGMVIYDGMALAIDPVKCFGTLEQPMTFRVKSVSAPTTAVDTFDGRCHITNSPFGILTPETEIQFVN